MRIRRQSVRADRVLINPQKLVRATTRHVLDRMVGEAPAILTKAGAVVFLRLINSPATLEAPRWLVDNLHRTPMKLRLVLLAGACLLSSCAPTIPVHMYATHGKAMQEAPYVKGTATMLGHYRGTMRFKWPDGEEGEGQYSGIANFDVTERGYSARSQSTTYDTYGPSSFQATSYGRNGPRDYSGTIGPSYGTSSTYGSVNARSTTKGLAAGAVNMQGIMITNRGRRLNFTVTAGSGSNSGGGVAYDDRGNFYKVIF